jgi:HK97 gp10 family phage protein
MAFSISLSGMKELEGKLNNLTTSLKKDVNNEINASALTIQKEAKRLAPINFGKLRGSIALTRDGELTYTVAANASYAAYVEFGTGGKVSIPAGYESFASQFRGQKGGTYYDFLLAILDWIKKKGIVAGTYSIKTKRRLGNKAQKFNEDVKLAESIAFSILKKGINPQPFLIPSFENEKPKLIQRLNNLLNA